MAFHWFHRLAVLPCVVGVKVVEVPVLVVADDFGKLVNLELLVLWGMRVIKSPLPQRYVFADEFNQPAILLIKLLAQLNKIEYNIHERCSFVIFEVWFTDNYNKKGGQCSFYFANLQKTRKYRVL